MRIKVITDGYGDYWAYWAPEPVDEILDEVITSRQESIDAINEKLHKEAMASFKEEVTETYDYDPVERPKHYNYADGGVECIDYIKQVLGLEGFIAYCRGNVIKYQHRASYKGNTTEDLKKALWYQKEAVQAQEELTSKTAS